MSVMTNNSAAKSAGAAKFGTSPQQQPALPWAPDALAPTISAETIGFHYGKHHQGYFAKLVTLVAGTAMADWTLEEIILATANDTAQTEIFNNAAQCWNHNFYWQSLSPVAQTPAGALLAAIDRDFGSFDAMTAELAKTTIAQFGTGWGWLVVDDGRLKIVATGDADVPFVTGQMPLLTIDVWEHAYYLDYQNRRPDHVKAVIDGHLDWRFAATRFAAA